MNPPTDPPAGNPVISLVPDVARRNFLERLAIALGGLCALILGAPVVAFIFAPFFRPKSGIWLSLGKVDSFEIGQTINVTFSDPSPLPWAGITARSAAWLRRESADVFIAFSVNCTHLGCPVRWLPDAQLFMCPCHGGVYYKDGSVAAGPPPRPLFRYEWRIRDGNVEIKSAPIPITTTV